MSGLYADHVLLGGRVRTMDPRGSVAEAIAIRADTIVAVGADADVRRTIGPCTQVTELRGRTVLPGVTDAHVHLASDASRAVGAVECRDFYEPSIRSVSDVLERVAAAARGAAPDAWIHGRASPLQDMRMAERRFPTRQELDAAAPNNPVAVGFGPHITVASSAALAARGITAATPSPAGGTVVKDPATGEPTGVLLERAQQLVRAVSARLAPEDLAERILRELEACARRGVTAIHDILVSREEIQAYQLLERSGRLPVRVQMMPRVIEANFSVESLLDLGLVAGFGSDWLRLGGVKMSVDGGFTGKSGAFHEPIHAPDDEDHPGIVRIDQAELDETVWRYHEVGMRCLVHTIGDRAMDMALEAYDKALTRLPRADHRHRVEHLGNWMISPRRLETITRLGLIPVPNPPFLRYFGDPLVEMLGPRMTEQGFPFRTLVEAGVPICFGSDSPGYYPVDPLRDAGTAVSHATLSGARPNAAESLTLDQALRAITVNAAHAGFVEHRQGSLEPGKLADLIVLAADPADTDPDGFAQLPVELTIVGGTVVSALQPA
jgi:predicted amidohydrolase YtcJ